MPCVRISSRTNKASDGKLVQSPHAGAVIPIDLCAKIKTLGAEALPATSNRAGLSYGRWWRQASGPWVIPAQQPREMREYG